MRNQRTEPGRIEAALELIVQLENQSVQIDQRPFQRGIANRRDRYVEALEDWRVNTDDAVSGMLIRFGLATAPPRR